VASINKISTIKEMLRYITKEVTEAMVLRYCKRCAISRYLPHQGKQEILRRQGQIARGIIKVTQGGELK
jgi:hypothetical protein